MIRHGHTTLDATHLRNPERSQPREHPVPCHFCGQSTRNLRAGCDAPKHYRAPTAR